MNKFANLNDLFSFCYGQVYLDKLEEDIRSDSNTLCHLKTSQDGKFFLSLLSSLGCCGFGAYDLKREMSLLCAGEVYS